MSEPKEMNDDPSGARREFIKQASAGVIGTVLGAVPIAAGITVLLDPLRRYASASGLVRVTTLEAVPEDGTPRRFQVLAAKVDAWNKFTQIPVGAVYLRRVKGQEIQAFNAVCPHAGCFVDFLPDHGGYSCPCHKSSFTVAGKIEDRSSPAPRGMDSLEVEVKDRNEIWVKFQNFQAGRPEKVPVA
jgi:menaquinol-cytochrome c reductase iron-sulfur subunit